MAFFDDLSKKVTKLGQDASQKTKSFTDGMKINGQISDQKKELSKMYEDLGRMLYAEESVRSMDKCSQIVTMIENGEKTLEELEKQLAVTKGEVACKNCGTFVPAGNAFCPSCGTKVEFPVPEANANGQDGSMKCTNCGSALDGGSAFCTNCGTPVNK